MVEFIIIICENIEIAMKISSILKEKNIDNKFMPTPSYFSEGCGMSIRVGVENFNVSQNIVEETLHKKGYEFYKAVKNKDDKLVFKK